jgi:hypothetical protein
MIVLSVAGIEATASERPEGYAQDVLSKGRVRGDGFVEFEDDVFAALVAKYSPGATRTNTTEPHGPGTELKKLLATVGITATPNCSCNARAAEMDRQGSEWCESNLDTIVGWLREEAEKRGLPFLDVAGRMLVRRAIKNARKQAKMD